MAAKWLKDTVFYEIYPQSFNDTNGDGIGDINGITEKLDYIKKLGCNALWINPCYDSPFKDAGYDVRDYKKVAPRYGTNEDLFNLFEEAHKKGIKVLLDLVPGHTSEEHEWFRQSQKAEDNEYSDRFIWTDFCFKGANGLPYVGGESERSGCYILNFFKCQPALNYGFLNVTEPWQKSMSDPAAIATREAMKDVMRFWLSHGCDGFRVDMASSLVKNDDDKKSGTSAIWRDVRRMLDLEFPEAAMVAEWSNPPLALRAGYDMDFCLNSMGSGYSTLMRDYYNHVYGEQVQKNAEDHSYFKKDAGGSINRFLDQYMDWYEDTKGIGYMSLLTCNHDTLRPSYNLDERELKLAYSFIFTLPGVPFLYYGDEIGMKYLAIPTNEGGYFRTGSRTPMQWSSGENLGFSEAPADKLYLPVDCDKDAPTVESQEKDENSLLNTVKKILALRHSEESLQADAEFVPVCTEENKPFVYKRGELFCMVNPTGKPLEVSLNEMPNGEVLYKVGDAKVADGKLLVDAQSFAVMR
ncbi:alpha-amylase family glycosyl hydrolase [Butyrivibrio sp. AE3004]|uniref:alpha-amylase family glycosyl hydrolase n=1 Tax=Butyrivibrio sp. AE3004 TaxID=1506994 RepID=UPI00049493A7|nr:alpha-amylase family glycosyl hydrolase [Butyrivibrio sp. AE3004]